MLRKATEMLGYNISAQDGEIGHVEDFYFDTNEVGETAWTVRYMVVDTGFWIFGRKVLIAPDALGTPDWDHKLMPVAMTKEQIKDSPEMQAGQPVTREYERNLRSYYGWPIYWGVPPTNPAPGTMSPMTGSPTTGAGYAHDAPVTTSVETRSQFGPGREEVPDEVAIAMRKAEGSSRQIHSVDKLNGFSILAQDGEIGGVSDVFIDDANWEIRYLLVDTGTWLPGRAVLIAPQWIEQLNLDDSTVKVAMTQEQIENSPEYDPAGGVDRDYEGALYNYYHYRTYW
ncbi:MAG: PRC-barrel domain-containing protein [Litorilinea sp.]